jgi:hypothetical protein
MKNYLWILLIGILFASCTTTFKASVYKQPVNVAVERNAHYAGTIEKEGFTALAATSKFSIAPNESMTPAIDDSVKSILKENNPFTSFSVEHEEGTVVNEKDLYILLILNKLKAYINVSRNRSVYDISGTFIIADGAGNVYSSKLYSVSEESSIGTLQSAQNEAVNSLMDAFFTVLGRTDFDKPVEGEDPEQILNLIKSNL